MHVMPDKHEIHALHKAYVMHGLHVMYVKHEMHVYNLCNVLVKIFEFCPSAGGFFYRNVAASGQ